MINKCSQILEDIYIRLQDTQHYPSLMGGESGRILFIFLYLKYFKKKKSFQFPTGSLQRLAEISLDLSYYPISGGKAGITWLFSFLFRNGAISKSDYEIICLNDPLMEQGCFELLRKGNYDYLHGATGIAYSLLYNRNATSQHFFQSFFHELNNLLKDGETVVSHYNFDLNKLDHSITNISLSHGITSILKFSLICIKNDICQQDAYRTAWSIIDYLLSVSRSNRALTAFPSMIANDTVKYNWSKSRLGWCYGDLGIAYILYQAANLFQDNYLLKFSTDVFERTIPRKDISDTAIYDACFCHGTSGVAHIYNRMWKYTSLSSFKEIRDFWIQQTIDFAYYNDTGLIEYRSYSKEQKYIDDLSLLEGATGVGLVLISYLTNDFSWDYLTMLND